MSAPHLSRPGICVASEKKPPRIGFQAKCGQRPTFERARIDPQAIRLLIGIGCYRMSMDDHFAMVTHVVQKIITYPAQIGPILLFKRDAWTYAGMNEGEVPYFYKVLAVSKKIDMVRGDQLGEAFRYLVKARHLEPFVVAPIASDGRIPTDPHEISQAANIARQRGKKTFLMIADQKARVGKLPLQLQRTFHDRRRVRAPIHEIAQQYDCQFGGTAGFMIGADQVDYLSEQIIATVDVANCVYASPFGYRMVPLCT